MSSTCIDASQQLIYICLLSLLHYCVLAYLARVWPGPKQGVHLPMNAIVFFFLLSPEIPHCMPTPVHESSFDSDTVVVLTRVELQLKPRLLLFDT